MKSLLRRPSAYISFPILVACLAAIATFNLPTAYWSGIAFLVSAAVGVVVIDWIIGIRLPPLSLFQNLDFAGTREGLVALAFAMTVLAFCVIELVHFPIPLIDDPKGYATFDNGRDHIRHISLMVWALPAIGLLCVKSIPFRCLFIAAGFIFPILVLDRNRLIAALFSVVMVLLLRRGKVARIPWIKMGLLAVAVVLIFGVLGEFRSGELNRVPLPFSELFKDAPGPIKWVLLYMSAGVYNFSAILAKGYTNSNVLTGQLLGGVAPAGGSGIPFDAEVINVGTEFFPMLLAFGLAGVAIGVAVLYTLLAWSMWFLGNRIAPFRMLLFLRMGYVCVMCPFAPQAFTWTNFGFIIICLVSPALSVFLPAMAGSSKHDQPEVVGLPGGLSSGP